MIAFTCTGCGNNFQVNDEFAGRKTKCPKCGTVLIVPAVTIPQTPPIKAHGSVTTIVALALATLALALALSALGVVLFRDPLGSGLAKYDFSTPKAALISQKKIELNKDIRALLELQSRTKNKKLKEAIETMEVRKEAEFQGKKILFVTFKEDGVNKYTTEAFEKHAETGFWIPTYVGSFTVQKDNRGLAEQMRRWEEAGQLSSR